VSIQDPSEPQSDLREIGFTDFEYWVRPGFPTDFHPKWIFFTATKPVN
jgi:hypothetical protein